MRFAKRYGLFLSFLLAIAVTGSSLLWTNLPAQGYMSMEITVPPAPIDVLLPSAEQVDIPAWMRDHAGTQLLVASDKQVKAASGLLPTSLYPIFDGSETADAFSAKYPHLPAESLSGYGRVVYEASVGSVQMLYLDSESMNQSTEALQAQLEWLASRLADKHHPIAFVAHLPTSADFWNEAAKVGLEAVVADGAIYVPSQLVDQPPSDMDMLDMLPPVSGSAITWNRWQPEAKLDNAEYLSIGARAAEISIIARDKQGSPIDQLLLAASRDDQIRQLASPLAMGSQWRYRVGGDDLSITVPSGFDMTGEHPITERFHLPATDWRSPGFDDSKWVIGGAPMGSSDDKKRARAYRTLLPAKTAAPSYYFRTSFMLDEEPERYAKIYADLSFEDGIVVYVNGEELVRSSIATGLLTPQSLAEPNEPVLNRRFDVTNQRSLFHKGPNSIAAEVHRNHPGSPNLLFDLAISTELAQGEEASR
ncbi:hypothetical protein PaecuDRAFT_4729 [Paenibacillus curdlanolyticus YK9]|uniref:Uncharacterized protein n=1 Tax=Paenibacillus curdlanolyticus YK9 TaxID=717606 RepID=E0IGD6_9BACL|nr:hypothetical protein [Paenibacillus curdlanolyticus]EFM08436.1 hypothetical protein PaecuDRAFT_4729 [Paenibacillus curdlanolyticus YK9]